MSLAFLKSVPLFSQMPEKDLEKLQTLLDVVVLGPGENLFEVGTPGNHAYLIEEGELEVLARVDGRDILLAVKARGSVIGEMALFESRTRTASVRARRTAKLLRIAKEDLDGILHSSPLAMQSLFATILGRLRENQVRLQQSEKMAQLGTFTAGITHELNNPAAAVQRGAEQLLESLSKLETVQDQLSTRSISSSQMDSLRHWSTPKNTSPPPSVDPLVAARQEEELEELLEELGIADAWELTPTLSVLAKSPAEWKTLQAELDEDSFAAAVVWMTRRLETGDLLREIREGSQRISSIVKALKSYSYQDQAPVLNVDVNQGLEDTLLILRNKWKQNIRIQRDYDPELPRILAYGSELNQVWTNLLDNAILALEDGSDPMIKLSTRNIEGRVAVEIEDNGPGIPADVQKKVFDSFFTTREPGQGTGLGLNISYNIVAKHHGEIELESVPGKTCFRVTLPVDFNKS